MAKKDHWSKVRAASPDGADKRENVRHGVLRQGRILFDGRTVYCAVRDFSSSGAKLQVGVPVPDSFELMVAGRQDRLRAELKWRDGDFVGVAFQQALSTDEVEAVRPRQRLIPRGR